MGNVVVMGRKTFESLGKPLTGRENWVLSRTASFDGVRVFRHPTEIVPPSDGRRLFVIGGAEIYEQALPLASTAAVTEIEEAFEGDAFAPQFGPEWAEVARQRQLSVNGLKFSFVTYQKITGV